MVANLKSWPAILAVLAGLAASGCGADREPAGSAPPRSEGAPVTRPIASAPDATAPPPDAPRSKRARLRGRRATRRPPRAETAPTQAARLPVVFTLRGSRAMPPTITVPAGIPVELTVVSADGRGHRVLLRAQGGYRLDVPAGGRASVRIASLASGRHPLLDSRGRRLGTLVIGGAPGP